MPHSFRLIDTGLRQGRANIAFDQAMVALRQAGTIGDSLRFIHFEPTALVGRHQDLGLELNLDYCAAQGIGTARRITGGGAIYLDPAQLGWALVCSRKVFAGEDLGSITRRICEAAAAGLSTLGIDARYRPRNDIEVGGRKISGTGGYFDGDVLMFQGTVLVDLDPATIGQVLNVPKAKLAKRDLDDAAQRVTTLAALLGAAPPLAQVQAAIARGLSEGLGIAFTEAETSAAEEDAARAEYEDEIGTDDFVAEIDGASRIAGTRLGHHIGAGGLVSAHLRLEGAAGDRVREVLFTGDYFVTPPRIVFDLESVLRQVRTDALGEAVRAYFAALPPGGLLSIGADDFIAALDAALAAEPVAA
ncbi:MAG: lipoate--protein ligase family protein [Sphingomonadales bacterium]|nr:lipoate--protein ligase family protein [Sphingomonadales bacterium]MBD3772671.1 lipoate--protein ligase family protein [Paracoccaceae bacterium]